MEFIDDSQLLAGLMGRSGMQPSLAPMDTEKHARGAPLRAVFCLPPCSSNFIYPIQRIIAWEIGTAVPLLVLRVGASLGLHEKHERSQVPRNEWRCRAVNTPGNTRKSRPMRIWMSGRRLHSAHSSSDFSGCVLFQRGEGGGRARCLNGQVDEIDLKGVKYLPSTREKT